MVKTDRITASTPLGFRRRLGVRPGQTTPDGKITVEFAECLGLCDFAPAALVDDGRVFGPLDDQGVDAMIDELNH